MKTQRGALLRKPRSTGRFATTGKESGGGWFGLGEFDGFRGI